MKDFFDVSALLYLLEHLSKGVNVINSAIKSISDFDAPFGFVHDIELASRCLSNALFIVRNEIEDVHQSS